MGLVINVNDKEVSIDLANLETVSDLINALLDGTVGDSDLIKSIKLDDRVIDNDAFGSTGSMPIANYKKISVTTIIDPGGAVVELIQKMNLYLASFGDGVNEVADRFRQGAIEEANQMLVLIIEGLQSLTELVETAKDFSKPGSGEIQIGDKALSSYEKHLSETLKTLHDGQEAKDWVTVADLLEYELGPSVEEWREILPILSDAIKEKTGR